MLIRLLFPPFAGYFELYAFKAIISVSVSTGAISHFLENKEKKNDKQVFVTQNPSTLPGVNNYHYLSFILSSFPVTAKC